MKIIKSFDFPSTRRNVFLSRDLSCFAEFPCATFLDWFWNVFTRAQACRPDARESGGTCRPPARGRAPFGGGGESGPVADTGLRNRTPPKRARSLGVRTRRWRPADETRSTDVRKTAERARNTTTCTSECTVYVENSLCLWIWYRIITARAVEVPYGLTEAAAADDVSNSVGSGGKKNRMKKKKKKKRSRYDSRLRCATTRDGSRSFYH